MTTPHHAILANPNLSGFEYGMLDDFQEEIARLTGASFVEIPRRMGFGNLGRKFSIGTRYAGLRRFLRTRGFSVSADVLWVVLMGPENWELDLCQDWDRKVGFKILYLFDTMERQIPAIRKVLKSAKWDLTISSFSGAVPHLEAATQRKWHCVPQGVKLDRFRSPGETRRMIDFCSYGRRLERIQASLKRFCESAGLHYDYTTTAGLRPDTKPQEHYTLYAWHLKHSIFNLCWPVELTTPGRVQSFSPITCRWFEAAAAGNVIVGKAPRDAGFAELFGPDGVVEVNPELSDNDLQTVWRKLWGLRYAHLETARQRYRAYSSQWSWEARVRQILSLAGLEETTRQPTVVNSGN
jgi:hypothetical protein